MTIVGEAYVAVKPDAKGFAEGAEKDVLSRVSSIAKKAAAILGAAFVIDKGVALIKDAIAEGDAANKAAAQTEAVIRSTGGAANVTSAQIDTLTKSLALKTGTDDDVVKSGSNMLLTFTNLRNEVGAGNNVFDQANATLLDMSKALGEDPKNAAIQLGKALNDPINGLTALRRVGVTFTDQQKEQIATMQNSGDIMGAQKVILGELNKEFGGSAEAQATAADKIKVAFQELKESLGQSIAPGITAVLPAVMTLTEALGPVIQSLGTSLGAVFTAIGPVIQALAPVAAEIVGRIGGVFTQLAPVLAPVGEAFANLFRELGPIINIIGEGLVAALQVAAPLISAFTSLIGGGGESYSFFGEILKVVGDLLRGLAPVFQLVGQVVGQVAAVIGPVLAQMVGAFQPLVPVIVQVAQLIAGVFAGAMKDLLPVLTAVWQTIGSSVMDAMQRLAPVIGDLAKSFAPLIPVIAQVAGQLSGAFAGVLSELLPVLTDLAKIMAGTLAEVMPKLSPIVKALGDALVQLAPSIATVAKAAAQIVEAFLPLLPTVADLISKLVQGLAPVLPAIGKVLGTVAEAVVTLAKPLAGVLKSALDAIAPLLPTISSAITEVAKVMGGAIVSAVEAFTKALVPVLPVIGDLIKALGPILGDVLKALAPALPSLAQAFVQMATSGSTLLVALMPLIEPLLKLATIFLEKIGAPVIEKIAQAVALLAEGFAKIVSFIPNLLSGIASIDWGSIGSKAGEVAGAIVGFFQDLPGKIAGFFADLPGRVIGLIGDLGGKLIGWAQSGLTAVVGALPGIVSGLIGFFTGLPGRIVTAVGDLGGTLWNLLKGAFDRAVDAVSTGISNVVDWVKKLPGRLIDLALSFAGAGVSLIGSFFDGLKNFASGVLDVGKQIVNTIIDFINDKIIHSINSALEFSIDLGVYTQDINPPDIPDIPRLHTGGVVPGRTGAEVPIIAMAGEVVLTADQARTLLGTRVATGDQLGTVGPGAAGGFQNTQYITAPDPVAAGSESARQMRDAAYLMGVGA